MNNLILTIKIKLLTLKAWYYHGRYMRLFNRYGGNHNANTATKGIAGSHRSKYNATMDQLFILDPETPKARLQMYPKPRWRYRHNENDWLLVLPEHWFPVNSKSKRIEGFKSKHSLT